jgi:UDP-N-acetylmuramate dehydrogenase
VSELSDLVDAGIVETEVPLGPLTTYKLGGPARWFVVAGDSVTVARTIEAARADSVPYVALGRGSNMVVSDTGYPGLVIQLGGELSAMEIDAAGVVSAGAAVPLPKLARACAKQGRGGLEFLVAVPGSVGGAVRMNAGCHGSETGDWLLTVETYRPGRGVATVERHEMEMSYRHNSLPSDDIVLGARFRTEDRTPAESEEIMRAITQWRKESQPGGTLNAGSVFKNPVGTSAGWLVDSVGLKGMEIGGARVSPRHANFFEAGRDASAQDVYDLVAEVRRRVSAATGVTLEPEIRFIGEFSEGPGKEVVWAEPTEPGKETTQQAGEGEHP